jgi:hypothetical protein
MVAIEAAYIAVFVAGFTSVGNTRDPLPDPYLGIAEGLILVSAPILVVLMMAIHETAPRRSRPFTSVALGWMMAVASVTTVVHVSSLSAAG